MPHLNALQTAGAVILILGAIAGAIDWAIGLFKPRCDCFTCRQGNIQDEEKQA